MIYNGKDIHPLPDVGFYTLFGRACVSGILWVVSSSGDGDIGCVMGLLTTLLFVLSTRQSFSKTAATMSTVVVS